MDPALLRLWAEHADEILAADGGADRLLHAGLKPTRIVGDLDSISPRARALDVPIDEMLDQDSTDCDKLLARAAALGHAEITVACVEGDSLDHLLASLYSALRAPITVRFALRRGIAWLLRTDRRPSLVVHTEDERRLSLIPLTPCTGVSLDGVHWPLHDALLSPGGRVSVSNRTTGGYVQASLREGAALLVLEVPLEETPDW